ncbi:MAG: protein kinase [Planctomycetales bacterium]|nr:protein kinase [Planctomycetales bacterium]
MSSSARTNQDELTLDQIAEHFLARIRAGERPSVREYVVNHPDLAAEIEELFPTLASLEQYDAADQDLPATSFDAPQQLGEYSIVREIGRGGMGVVYEALHTKLQRRVALKVLPSVASTNQAKRFLREARAAGQLHHTNIVPIFDVGEANGIHYYAMQFIHGQNLDVVLDELRRLDRQTSKTDDWNPKLNSQIQFSQRVSESTVALWTGGTPIVANLQSATPEVIDESSGTGTRENPLGSGTASGASSQWSLQSNASLDYYKRVAAGARQVAEALAHAHSHGVLHRDIKPSNLLLDTEGVIWVSDFGLAKDDSENLTHTGDIIGTLRYMSPERFSGTADARSDVYSLGLTLYEMCTLRYAFQETDRAQLMQQITNRDPVAPRRIRPEIPLDLETVILKAIAREPIARYQSARQLAADLERFVADLPVLARRVSFGEKAWRWCRRNPSYALLFGCLAMMLAFVVLGALGFAIQALQHARELRQETLRAVEAEQEARKANLRSNRSLYKSYVGYANASRWSQRRGQRYETIDQLRNAASLLPMLEWSNDEVAAETLKLRNAAIAAMPLVDVQEIASWPTHSFARGAISADGRLAAWSEDDGLLMVRDVDRDQIIASLQGPAEQAWVVRFDPSGQFISAKFHDDVPLTPAKLLVWEIPSKRKVLDIRHGLGTGAIAFDPAKAEMVLCRNSGSLEFYSLPAGELQRTLDLGSDVKILAYNPSGQLSYTTGDGVVRIVQPDGEGSTYTFPAAVHSYEWLANGDLVVGGRDGSIHHRSAASGEIRSFGKHSDSVAQILSSPDDGLLVSEAWGGTRRIYDLRSEESLLSLESFNIDGIARVENRICLSVPYASRGVWRLATGAPLHEIHTNAGRHWDVVAHPIHESIVAVTCEHGVDLWDIDRDQRILVIPGVDVSQLAFSPDGSRLYVASTGKEAPVVHSLTFNVDSRGEIDVVLDWSSPIPNLNVERPPGRTNHLALDSQGKRLVILNGLDQAHVVDTSQSTQPVVLGKHHMVSRVDISPDGSQVVTSTWNGEGIRIWSALTGDMLKDLAPRVGNSWPAYSPDGRWLVATSKENDYVWDTESWQRRVIERGDHAGFEGRIAFSPNSNLAVIWKTQFIPRLIDLVTGREIAALESPNRRGGVPVFTRSGRRLVIASSGCLQIWDMEKMQAELAELGLDW